MPLPPPRPAETDAAAPGAGLPVVLVEDHPVVREQLTELLGIAGIPVVAAVGTLGEGYRAVIDHHPCIAVLDNGLPDGRGIDLCRTLRQEAPDVRVLIHAGSLTPSEELEARQAGAADILLKSIRGTPLIDSIRALRGGPRPGPV